MSAHGTKRRTATSARMSALGGNSGLDMLPSNISGFDHLRHGRLKTFAAQTALFVPSLKRDIVPLAHAHDLRREGSHGNPDPTARIHIRTGRGGGLATRGASAATVDTGDRFP